MKRTHFLIFFLVGCISLFGLVQESLGLTYPINSPAGELSGGTYYSYFQNMFPGCTTGQVIQNFTSTGMPNCVTPAASTLSLTGQALGHTIYFDGTNWISSNNIFNSGGAVSIGGVTPQSAFEVWRSGVGYLHFRGNGNLSIGQSALPSTNLGAYNVAVGYQSLRVNGTGTYNTAVGVNTLYANTFGSYNVALGENAMYNNLVGTYNVALGRMALFSNTGGTTNTAVGTESMYLNRTGGNNVSLGRRSLYSSISSNGNTALGTNTLYTVTSGANNIGIGYNAGSGLTTGSNNIGIGYNVMFPSATTSNQLNIGNSIFGSNIGTTTNQIVLGTGSLTTSNSSVVVKVNGNIQISGSGAGAGKILTAKDANGLAEWGDVFATNVTSSGVVGGTGSYGYLIKFGSGGIGLELSSIFETGGFLGIGTTNPRSFIEIAQSGALYMHFRGTNTVALGKFALNSLSGGVNNTSIGYGSLSGNTIGSYNIAIGSEALNKTINSTNNIAIGSQALYNTLSGTENVAIGRNALAGNTTGNYNTALGSFSLSGNTSGQYNIGFGFRSLAVNTTGTNNIAFGYESMSGATGGDYNIGIGNSVLASNQGNYNIALGYQSLLLNILSGYNVAIGHQSLLNSNGGTQNIAIGYQTMYNNTIGDINIAIGKESLYFNLDGNYNVGVGYRTLYNNISTDQSTAIGYQSLYNNAGDRNVGIGYFALYGSGSSTGFDNVAIGTNAMKVNTSGQENTAVGNDSMMANTSGLRNTAVGNGALKENTTGDKNNAFGNYALMSNTTGYSNVAMGRRALYYNTEGAFNIGLGDQAGYNIITGTNNTAFGNDSLYSNTGGTDNIAIGASALFWYMSNHNIAIGNNSQRMATTGNHNIALGTSSLMENSTGTNNTAIGYLAMQKTTNAVANVAIGAAAGQFLTGYTNANIAIGVNALYGDDSGSGLSVGAQYNIGIGNNSLQSITTGYKNIALGQGTLRDITSGYSNIGLGHNTLFNVVSGSGNIAIGDYALYTSSSTIDNLAIGVNSMYSIAGGKRNVAIGNATLSSGTTAADSVIIGYNAGFSTIAGKYNVALGSQALYMNAGGDHNIAIGYQSLYNNVGNSTNIAIGSNALYENFGAAANVALGTSAMMSNLDGAGNTSMGSYSMQNTASGNYNAVLGYNALQGSATGTYANRNVAIGANTFQNFTNLTTSIAIGYNAGLNQTGGTNNIVIGAGVDLPNLGGSSQLNIQNEIYGSGMGTASPWIGINTNVPTATLDVNGSIRMRAGAFSGAALLSNASGTAYWGSVTVGSVSASGVTGGVQNYITKFGTGGNGLISSLLFDNGTQVGIGTATPLAGTELDVTGDARFTGNVTVQGNLIADKIVNRTVTNITISGSILPDTTAPLTYRDIGSSVLRWNNLYLSGQIAIGGGSPGVGKVLTSDANGLATWVTGFSGSYTSSGITGGTQNFVPKFGTSGNGLILSSIYDDGINIGIGTSTGTSRFEVWSGSYSIFHTRGAKNTALGLRAMAVGTSGAGANSAFGNESMYILTTGYQNSGFGNQAVRNTRDGYSNVGVGHQALYNNDDGDWNVAVGTLALDSPTGSNYNVAVGGEALGSIGSAQGNVAIGHNALYGLLNTASNNTAIGYMAGSGLTTGQNNILIGNGVQAVSSTASNQLNIGNWIFGSGGNIGIGLNNPDTKLTVDSGVPGVSGIRVTRVNASTTANTGITIGLGLDMSGNLVPIQKSNIAVFTAKSTQSTQDTLNYLLPLDYNWYPVAGAQQTFAATDVSNTPKWAPNLAYGASSVSVCNATFSVTGATTGGCTDTPWATYVTTSYNIGSSNSYAYQMLMSDRTDAPIVFRGGQMRRASNNAIGCGTTAGACALTGGIYSGNGSAANWFSVLSVPANHGEYFFINSGFDVNNNAISGGGKIGVGNNTPSSYFTVYGASFPSMSSINSTGSFFQIGTHTATNILFDNDAIQAKSNATTAGSLYLNPYGGNVGIGLTSAPSYKFQVAGDMAANGLILSYTGSAASPAWTFSADTNNGIYSPSADALAVTTAGTERMRIFSNGNVSIGSTTNSAKLRVEGQVMITGGVPGAGKVLTSDASGLATWQTPSGGGSGSSFNRYTYILSTAQTRSANSLADLGLTSVSLPVGTYNFKMTGIYQTAAATTGIGFALASNGAVVDRYVGQLSTQNNANSTDEVSSAVLGTALLGRNVQAANTDYAAIYQGTFRVTTAGAVKIQFQSEVNTSLVTVQPGTNLVIEQL